MLVQREEEPVHEQNGVRSNSDTEEKRRGVQELDPLGVHARRVERPFSERETQEILAGAFQEGLTVLPCGGGTAMGAGVLPETVDIALDMTGLDRMLAVDPNNLNIAVLAGITVRAVNEYLAEEKKKLFLPLDPPLSHQATIGGVYASNASGPSRLLYGTVRDLALGVRGVNAKGEEIGFGGKTVKNVSGLDLTKFLIGSAGSLAVITSVSLRIVPVPEAVSLCELDFDGEGEIEKFLSTLRGSALTPTAAVISDRAIDPSAGGGDNSGFRALIAFEGHSQAVDRQNKDVLRIAQRFGGRGSVQEGRENMLTCISSAIDPEKTEACLLTLKISVPIAQGLRTYKGLRQLSGESGVSIKTVLFAGNGIVLLYATGATEEALFQLIKGVRETIKGSGGFVIPVRAPRSLLSNWGPRVNQELDRLVLRPIKNNLDPTGVFPPII